MTDVKTYDASFAKIYRFMEKHLSAESDDDFREMVRDIGGFVTDFERNVAVEVVAEIERVYKARHGS